MRTQTCRRPGTHRSRLRAVSSRRAERLTPVATYCPNLAVTFGVVTVRPDTLAPDDLEGHRRELTAYCYLMLGSGFDGRSSVRSWLYRIATNVCVDMLRGRQRRARPMELGPSRPPVESSLEAVLPEGSWVSPIADERVLPPEADPAEVAVARDSIRLAFVAALQHLPARQRAALILCEVLRWQAAEAAELLDTSVAAVNSALQRARAHLAEADLQATDSTPV